MNCCIGPKTKKCISVGTYGLKKTNGKGIEAINLLWSFNFKADLTFYDYKHEITWKSFDGKNTAYQLDQWVVNLLSYTKDAYIIYYGVYSDHSAIKTDSNSKKVKKKLTLYKQIIN